MQIEPDLFGKLNVTVAIEGYEAPRQTALLKWIADAARLNRNFIPSLASRDIAERLNISRTHFGRLPNRNQRCRSSPAGCFKVLPGRNQKQCLGFGS
jgi:hypothetical protein